jgi:hypothetical protein
MKDNERQALVRSRWLQRSPINALKMMSSCFYGEIKDACPELLN